MYIIIKECDFMILDYFLVFRDYLEVLNLFIYFRFLFVVSGKSF